MLQAKMMGVQKLGARINQLQQAEDFAGAESLYGQVCFLSCFLMGHPELSTDCLKHSVFQFNAAVSSLVRPPHQFYVIAGRSHASCLWVRWGTKSGTIPINILKTSLCRPRFSFVTFRRVRVK